MNPFYSANPTPQSHISSKSNSANESSLANILEQESHCLDELIELLKVENEAILQRDTELMGKLLDKKLPLLSQLDQLEQQRQSIFSQISGHSYSHKAFSDYVEQSTSEPTQTLWQAIKLKLPECKKQNELNGRIISIRQNNTDQILQILLGRPQNNAQTYSHLGQTRQQKRSALYTSV